jgi:phosphohistidine phosphatase SixA
VKPSVSPAWCLETSRRRANFAAMTRVLVALLALMLAAPALAERIAVATETAEGRALVERLRAGGHVLFFRHADTIGMPCDRSFRVGDREGQRNISERGREQSRAIGRALSALGVPAATPVLAGPVYRARDTAEEAFGAARVRVTDDLLADDYAGGRLAAVLDAHRRLFSQAVPVGANRVLVGHRTPAIMVLGPEVGGRAFPEGAAIVLFPRPPGAPEIVGIWMPAPIPGGGFHGC